VACFFEVDKTCADIFGILPRFMGKLLESEKIFCSSTARTKTAPGVLQLWIDYFEASFLKALGKNFSRQAED